MHQSRKLEAGLMLGVINENSACLV